MNSPNGTTAVPDPLDQRNPEEIFGTLMTQTSAADDFATIRAEHAKRRAEANLAMDRLANRRKSLVEEIEGIDGLVAEMIGAPHAPPSILPPPPRDLMPDHPVTKVSGVVGRVKLPPLVEGAAGMTERVSRATRKPRKAKPVAKASAKTKKEKPAKGPTLFDRFLTALRNAGAPLSNGEVGKLIGVPQQRAASLANQLKNKGKLVKHGKGKKITWTAANGA